MQSAHAKPQAHETQGVAPTAPLRLHTGCTGPVELPPELARVVEAWPVLPQHVQSAILALVDVSKPARKAKRKP